MSTSAIKLNTHAINVHFSKTSLHFTLADGREISAPLSWFPRLQHASNKAREDWHLIGNGIGVHWPQVDEDISVESLMRGQ